MSVRLLLPLGAALLVAFAACSGSENHDSAPPDDAGADVRRTLDAGHDVALGPVGPTHPTPRCENPKAAGVAFELPDGGGAGSNEAGTIADAGASGDAGGDAAPLVVGAIRPPRVPSFGGPVLSAPRWVPIFYRDTDDEADLSDFLGSIGCTDYWHTIASEYGVGEGVSAPSVIIDEDAPARLSDSQIQKFLAKQITAGVVEKPTPNTLYVVFFPLGTTITGDSLGTSCFEFGGYHSEFSVAGTSAAYAVIPRCGDFDQLTSTTTHELIEAATDPYVQSYPAYSTPADDDIVWALAAGGEVADLCTFVDDMTITFGDYPYAVQRSFSNKSSLAGHDPCVPTTHAYFYAAPSLESSVVWNGIGRGMITSGVNVPPGTSKTVDVTLGADDPSVGTLQVLAVPGSKLNLQISGTGNGSTFTLDKSSGQPGEHLRLTINATSNASAADVFALVATYLGRRHYWYGLVTH